MNIACDIFKSAKQPDTYLYLPVGKDQAQLPEGLLALLGEITPFLTIDVHPQRHLAQAKADEVLKAIQDNGFYLQMAPDKILAEQAE